MESQTLKTFLCMKTVRPRPLVPDSFVCAKFCCGDEINREYYMVVRKYDIYFECEQDID